MNSGMPHAPARLLFMVVRLLAGARGFTLKVQRPCAELRKNGAAKRHLPFPFSAHLLDFKRNPISFIVAPWRGMGFTLNVRRRIGGINSGMPNVPAGLSLVVACPHPGA